MGKGTLVSRLLERDPSLWLSRSWTTRSRRPGEPADAYTFATREQFEARVRAGGFLEWAEFLGHLYGTPTPEPPPGLDVVLEIELQGAQQVLERVPGAVLIFVVPPSMAELRRRLEERGDSADHVRRRLESAQEEEALGRAIAAHVVVNDDLERAVAEVAGILDRHRERSSD